MNSPEIWFVTGSQHLYGPEVLKQVAEHSRQIVEGLNSSSSIHTPIVLKPVMTDPDAIRDLCLEANNSKNCAGLILFMHTFSPSKMWIGGLGLISKPICHLHTQFNKELPWKSIDMDFMNLNQAAHGDREAGHIHSRLGLKRKVVVGHWSDKETQADLGGWVSVARAWNSWQGAKFGRFGDNMRQVAVTEGDKVSAEIQFGFSVNGYGVGDLVEVVNDVSDSDITNLVQLYEDTYDVAPELRNGGNRHDSLRYSARQELGIRAFLESRDLKGFTTTFEDLHGLDQLPGLACQRLMADGYGFGAEGDWKTAALLQLAKQMEFGQESRTSFMEDYTYDLTSGGEQVLGAHMLEICPSIARSKPRLEIHPLGIGGKSDPVRMVFDAISGPALNASLVDLGHRFRLIVNEVEAIDIPEMPNLPVARALWKVKPDFRQGVAAWIYAGGAHHTVYSYNISTSQLRDLAEIAGIECVVINESTQLETFRNELRWNEVYYRNNG